MIFGLTIGIAIPLYAAKGVHSLPIDIGRYWLGATLATGCYALLGVAVGALVRNTVGAVSAPSVWVQVVEQLLLANLFPELAEWLPTGRPSGSPCLRTPGRTCSHQASRCSSSSAGPPHRRPRHCRQRRRELR